MWETEVTITVKRAEGDPPPEYYLTEREKTILALAAEGFGNKQIGSTIEPRMSVHTVKNHMSAIMAKLKANNRTHAVVLALRHGLMIIEEVNNEESCRHICNSCPYGDMRRDSLSPGPD